MDGRRPAAMTAIVSDGDRMLWLNGRLVAADAARIDPSDRGFLLGDGLFETMRAAGGRVPLLGRHLARLRAGAALLGLPVPLDDAGLAAAASALLEAEGLRDAAIRLTLTRGPGPRGLLPPPAPAPTVLLAAFPLPAPPPPARAAFVQVTRRNERSPLSRLKALGYLDNLLALQEARAAGTDEPILLNTAGRLACAATANLFLIAGGTLLTPPLAEGVLPGITRALVLELARGLGVACREVPLPPEHLARAEGAFLTSSLAGMRAITYLDGQPLGDGTPHPLAEMLQTAWQAHPGP
jgi:branched-chain amino acid aminotransferase